MFWGSGKWNNIRSQPNLLSSPWERERMEESTIAKQKKNVPVLPWMRSPVDVSKFEEYPLDILPCLDPRLKMALQNMGFKTLFPVQIAVWQETIGPGAFERDLCINSPTGSGKTLAYALPIVQMLSTRAVKCLRALVVLPTRDLALQVKQVFAAIAPAMGLSVGLAVGQSSIADEISELIKKPEHEAGICYDPQDVFQELQSSVDILVATPGRLMDHIATTKGFTLEHLCYLVVDETDRLLREAYQSWLPTVLKLTRPYDEGLVPGVNNFLPCASGSLKTIRRCGVERGFKGKSYPRLAKMVLSATLTQDPSKLAQLDLHHPLFLTTGQRRYQLPEKLESYKLICMSKLKPLYLVAVLQHLGGEKCIVFTSSVESTHRLCTLLNFFDDLKVKIKEYSGLQRQSVRSKTLKAFREGEIQVLVSSDAMTRGMDIEGVRNIINYDMPAYVKTYVHRAGRTARAGQTGRCITLLRTHEVKRFKKMLQKADNDSCPIYSIPSSSVKSLHPFYLSALEKLKETVQSETSRKGKVGHKFSRVSEGEKKSLEE
ncbi:PREDICTED: DEAD-box ATP-dependent RNA helicase 1 isoform X1 [Populus euphratica]|uniref:ATP-dependent RNA helicase n=2 Tax=Populus euphratica TaxID=75702 RepID=A0AAJ6Y0D4_POPEU|nr:PREDICTED: DEAD-box ATP-dependent RNA helicase 1 isoform X1 [Populus euphratica]